MRSGRAPLIALAITAALGVAYLVLEPKTADLAAATFRADLFAREGFVLENDAWYGGHTVPGYSLLYPPLGALLGPALVCVLSALAATAIFSAIATRAVGERDAWLGIIWFGIAATVAMWGSRVPFALGVALGLGALLALQRDRTWIAVALGVGAALASPVAGLFTSLAAAAVFCAGTFPLGSRSPADPGLPVRSALYLAVASFAATAAIGLGFPTDGYEPFRLSMYLWIPGVTLATLLLVPREQSVVRWGAVLYLALGTLAYLIETPLGDNVVRFGYTFAGPVLALVLIRTRPLALAVIALPLLYWQWTATANDVYYGLNSPTAEREFHAPLLAALDEKTGGARPRVQVVPTRTRWEAVHVAERYPLARGWLRQLESDDFVLFQHGNLDADAYEDWLEEHDVSYVALTREAELDYLGEDEAKLLLGSLPFLREIPVEGEEWRLWEVRAGS